MKYLTHTPKKNDYIIWFVSLIVILVTIKWVLNEPGFDPYYWIFPTFTLGLFALNILMSKSLLFKNYFTSPYNIFTSKVHSEITFDITRDLMFEKLVEVIKESNFKLIKADETRFEILAFSGITWKSWGENLYISLEEKGDETILKFCSVTIFQMVSWGKNKKNLEQLIQSIDDSLTV